MILTNKQILSIISRAWSHHGNALPEIQFDAISWNSLKIATFSEALTSELMTPHLILKLLLVSIRVKQMLSSELV